MLNKRFERISLITIRYKGQDLALKTDLEGNPISLLIGHKNKNGKTKGERYVRTLKTDAIENITKDHWELKGKSKLYFQKSSNIFVPDEKKKPE